VVLVGTRLRTLVLGDLHLVRESPASLVGDLERLLSAHPGSRIVAAGDVFDLSADHPGAARDHALREACESMPRVTRALARHLDQGGELWITAGNHDAALGDAQHHARLAELLGLGAEARARLRTTPWFIREGGLHVEHGHLHDPDNAMPHPLATEARSLGVRFVEEFVAPTGAHRYLNNNDKTPLWLFLSAFAWYGRRGPYVVYRFFHTAFRALAESGPFFDEHGGRPARAEELRDYAERHELDLEGLELLAALYAEPTLRSFVGTFQRLYLDRVAATLALGGGAALLATGHGRLARASLSLGALAMGASWALGYDRYGGSVAERLERGASAIAEASDAELVVMGHAHEEATGPRYANTGSFAFPREAPGRPYLEIEGSLERPRAVRRYLGRTG